jgi:hypothetical protein
MKSLIASQRAFLAVITVFWDNDGVVLVDVIARGETISSDTLHVK